MAIDRKDYQYIHNSLDKTSVVSNDNSLKVGNKVKNLLLELKEENIWNGDFPDYYGKRPSHYWEPFSIKGESTEKVISETFGVSENVEKITVRIPGSGDIGIVEGYNTSASNIHSTRPTRPTRPSQNTYYKLTYNYTFNKDIDIETVRDISVTNAISSLLYDNASYKWTGDRTICCYFYSTSKTVQGYLSYKISKTSTEDKTVENGVLYYITSVKPKTSYVLQVVNATLPSNVSTGNRNIVTVTDSNNVSRNINFNQYLFFETGNNEVKIKLTIEGLSFGYQIYGLEEKEVNGEIKKSIYEKRCFKTTTQAKVFLFETKYPWLVDNNGIITGLTEACMNVSQKSSNTPVKASFSTEQLESLFKEAPSFYISNSGKTLNVLLPNSVLENKQWKWKNEVLWRYAGQNTDYPKIMDNIYLLAYRNFLTEEIRDYNNIKITTQYGLLRTIQKTCKSIKDKYAQTIDYSIQLNQKLISNISPKNMQLNSTIDPISFSVPIKEKTIAPSTDINLCIFPLLGCNYTYGIINNKSDMYKYTAISFAWGKKEGNKFVRLSDFSIPIIVDRSIITISINKEDNTKYDLKNPNESDSTTETFNWQLTLRDSTNYYPFSAIYLDAVAQTIDTTNE